MKAQLQAIIQQLQFALVATSTEDAADASADVILHGMSPALQK